MEKEFLTTNISSTILCWLSEKKSPGNLWGDKKGFSQNKMMRLSQKKRPGLRELAQIISKLTEEPI